uniref:Uncharacterized protein n=1 Tax=Zea mays TaxID=4577 RepID=B4FGN8_MAIZE|nr:unknown [Zea mays]
MRRKEARKRALVNLEGFGRKHASLHTPYRYVSSFAGDIF